MKLQLEDAQRTYNETDTNIPRKTTVMNDVFVLSQLDELQEAMSMFENGAETLNEDVQCLNTELLEHQNKLQHLKENASNVKLAVEEEHMSYEAMMRNLEVLSQELMSLKDKIDEMQYVSYDGTFLWKITNFQEKMNDALSERQPSIYSTPFYSSRTGYKMQARLYLNGEGNARRTHMSLFFVLMRGLNDAILKFPFNYKVIFCLYDQTSQQRHIIDSFRPDIRSSSFQRSRSEMNIASGIPKFFSLTIIQREDNLYVRDGTIFIKIMVDFGDMPKTLLRFALTSVTSVLEPTFLKR
ncbi:unnamed protein product [Rotaria sp. Silwood2]|nr:unnamed protein product [Rotaria sp. Silwood2]CAF4080487.1 unnamed protein product [Rotaria sp. Silwood2]